jgi:hypothetical protein
MEIYKNFTNDDYELGSYKQKIPLGYGYKRKLTGKGINNPWIEFIKNNRGKFSSLKELLVLYHSKRK